MNICSGTFWWYYKCKQENIIFLIIGMIWIWQWAWKNISFITNILSWSWSWSTLHKAQNMTREAWEAFPLSKDKKIVKLLQKELYMNFTNSFQHYRYWNYQSNHGRNTHDEHWHRIEELFSIENSNWILLNLKLTILLWSVESCLIVIRKGVYG